MRSRRGPWLLYDDVADPYQLRNLVDDPAAADVRDRLDAALDRRPAEVGDAFLAGDTYLARAGLTHDREANAAVGSSEGPGGSRRSTMAVPSGS